MKKHCNIFFKDIIIYFTLFLSLKILIWWNYGFNNMERLHALSMKFGLLDCHLFGYLRLKWIRLWFWSNWEAINHELQRIEKYWLWIVCVAMLGRVYAWILSNWKMNCDFMVHISLNLVMWDWKLGQINGFDFMTIEENSWQRKALMNMWLWSIMNTLYPNGEFMVAGILFLVKRVSSSYCSPRTNFWLAHLSPWSCCESNHVLHTRRHNRWAKQTMFYLYGKALAQGHHFALVIYPARPQGLRV